MNLRTTGRLGSSTLIITLVMTCGVTSCTAEAKDSPEKQARQILEATGGKGGLIVHLGCGDGRLTTALCANDGYLVHGLDGDDKNVGLARSHVQSRGLCGKVTIDRLGEMQLPYVDNLVNLVVVSGLGVQDSGEEIARVLAPGGVALVKGSLGNTETRNLISDTLPGLAGWSKFTKPRPDTIDEWTHYLHDATGNAVAHDMVVGPPQHVQWISGPWHARQHDHLASVSAVVSAEGRMFYIVDEGPIAAVALPAKWSLVASDAFNGIELWKRPVPSWETHLRRFRSGPTELARRLVVAGDRVYVTLGYDAAISALDAATGQTIKTYDETKGAEEIVCDEGVLFVVVGTPQTLVAASGEGTKGPWAITDRGVKRLMAVEADTGRVLWAKDDADAAGIFSLTLAVGGDRVFYQNAENVFCLDKKSGRELWRHAHPTDPKRPGWSSPTFVAYEDVVLCADRIAETKEPPTDAARNGREFWTFYRGGPGKLVALSAENGRELWNCECAESFHAPADVFVADGLVWVGQNHARWLGGELNWLKTDEDWYKEEPTLGRDPRTGEVRRRLMAGDAFTPTHHHRCYRNKATDRFMLLGRTGVEFIDLKAGDPLRHNWIRGTCQYGIMPCNGLLYATPHSCACYIQSKLNGFWALAGESRVEGPELRAEEEASNAGDRLQRGPAYGDIQHPASSIQHPDAWPTYRHDPARSGSTKSNVPVDLKRAWQTDLGGKLSSVVVADGKLFVAQVDAHTVHALDAESGERLWSYMAGGRVDSPPTICTFAVPPSGGSDGAGRTSNQKPPKGGATNSLCLFGSADGCVYCLRAADGELVWRFRARPVDRRIVAFGRVESVWPVPGSVLVQDDVAYFAAGRSSYLDGGMHLYRLNVRTGEELSESRLYDIDPVSGGQPEERIEGLETPGTLPDIPSSDGKFVFLRDAVFDGQGVRQEQTVRHLYCPMGFLDGTWWHRTYWMYGTHFYSGAGGWPRAAREFPSGRILVFDDETIYGFGRRPEYYRWTTSNEYHLFATAKNPQPAKQPKPQGRKRRSGRKWQSTWSQTIPLHARAMVLADRTVFVAGPPDETDEASPQTFMLRSPLADGLGERALAAWEGKNGALLWAVSTADGKKLSGFQLESPPVWDGMAAAAGRLYVATTDGKVLCFGGDQ